MTVGAQKQRTRRATQQLSEAVEAAATALSEYQAAISNGSSRSISTAARAAALRLGVVWTAAEHLTHTREQ